MRRALVFAALLLAGSAFAASATERATAAIRRALNGRADWRMTRRLGEKGPFLSSSGSVACVLGSGIVWRVTAPFESSVAMTTNAMVFADEDGLRVKPLGELPHYAEIRAKTDAFAAGDETAFDGVFALSSASLPSGGWRVTLKPEVAAMRHLFTALELIGVDLPTEAVLRTADGGFCKINFSTAK